MPKEPQKNQAAVALGKLRASKMTTEERSAGGKARAVALTAARRSKIAKLPPRRAGQNEIEHDPKTWPDLAVSVFTAESSVP